MNTAVQQQLITDITGVVSQELGVIKEGVQQTIVNQIQYMSTKYNQLYSEINILKGLLVTTLQYISITNQSINSQAAVIGKLEEGLGDLAKQYNRSNQQAKVMAELLRVLAKCSDQSMT